MIFKSTLNNEYKLYQSTGEDCYDEVLEDNIGDLYEIDFRDEDDEESGENLLEGLGFDKKSLIVFAENMGYIGTFEEEVFQCGFLTRDKEVINYLRNRITEEDNNELFDKEYIELEIILMNSYLKANRLMENILRGAFKEDEDGNGYYNDEGAKISLSDLSETESLAENLKRDLIAINNEPLKVALFECIDRRNVDGLIELCKKNGLMKELANLKNEEDRSKLSQDAKKEILELYERICGFENDVFALVEQMIDKN